MAFSAAIMVRRWLSRIWEINSLNIKLHIKRLCLMGYVEGYTKNSNKQVVKIQIGTTKSFDSDAMYFPSVLWQLTSSTEVSVVDFSKVKPHLQSKPLQMSIFSTSLFHVIKSCSKWRRKCYDNIKGIESEKKHIKWKYSKLVNTKLMYLM